MRDTVRGCSLATCGVIVIFYNSSEYWIAAVFAVVRCPGHGAGCAGHSWLLHAARSGEQHLEPGGPGAMPSRPILHRWRVGSMPCGHVRVGSCADDPIVQRTVRSRALLPCQLHIRHSVSVRQRGRVLSRQQWAARCCRTGHVYCRPHDCLTQQNAAVPRRQLLHRRCAVPL